jgi:ribose 5-phosphate isomerase
MPDLVALHNVTSSAESQGYMRDIGPIVIDKDDRDTQLAALPIVIDGCDAVEQLAAKVTKA